MTGSISVRCHGYQNVTNEVMRWQVLVFRYAGMRECCLIITDKCLLFNSDCEFRGARRNRVNLYMVPLSFLSTSIFINVTNY